MRLWQFLYRSGYDVEVIVIVAENFSRASQYLMELKSIDIHQFETDVKLVSNAPVKDLAHVEFFHGDGTNYQKEGWY